ncbi:MAG: hypothetical protein FWE34_02700 [Defluviitaleaceae bacterium]|nr:hypothetical protein [Defluviitaleaceae bacterium]
MEKKRERIMKICGVVYWVMTVAVVLFVLFGLSFLAREIWPLVGSHEIWVQIAGIEVAFLYFDLLPIAIPFIDIGLTGPQAGPIGNIFFVISVNLFGIGVLTGLLLYIRHIFKDLSRGGSPFSKRIVNGAYFLMTILLWSAILDRDLIGLFIAALVGLFCLILDYGRILQEDADTTL